MYALDFTHRSDGGPSLIGPFGTKPAAVRWVDKLGLDDSCYEVRPLYVPDH